MFWRLYCPLLVVLLVTTFVSDGCSTCDGVGDVVHAKLSKDLERALLSDETNLFQLRRAFYYSPTAAPVLLKVVYNISYGNNITNASDSDNVSSCEQRSSENSTSMDFKQQQLTYGWTSSGVYTLFHPLVLSTTQALIPFAAMRIVHLTLNRRSPEADTFLWDGSYDLPILPLDIHITSLSCIPSQKLLESAISDINTLLKIYAGQQNVFKFIPENHMIGFTLPSTSVTATIMPSRSDITIVNLYSATLCFTYGVSVVLFIAWYYINYFKETKANKKNETHKENEKHKENETQEENKVKKKMIDEHLKRNKEIYAGLLITAVTSLAIEMVTRFVKCIVWTANIDNFSGTFLAVWLPQGDIFFMATFVNICGHIFTYINIYLNTDWTKKGGKSKSNVLWRLHLSSMHVILPLALITFGLFYTLLPAVILIFAYPTQMIAIMACILSFLFATSIFSAILFKSFLSTQDTETKQGENNLVDSEDEIYKDRNKKIMTFFGIFIPFSILIIYVHCIAIVFLYSLIIGRGSVITTGPIFVISLLPPAFLSSVTWTAKQYFLNQKSDTSPKTAPPMAKENCTTDEIRLN